MQRVGVALLLGGLTLCFGGLARGQDDSRTSSRQAEEGAYTTPGGRFPIRRGFFAEGDFGIFLAFGGRNTNVEQGVPPSRTTSNLEPTVGLTLGYDVASSPSFNLGLGVRGALLLNGGAGRVSEADALGGEEDPSTRSNDFAIYEVGVAAHGDFYVTDRLSVSTKLDGGLAILNPDPSVASATRGRVPIEGAGGAGLGGMGSLAVGINYATLLTGFQVGLDIRFVAVFFDGLIPALSATVPIKYNF